MKPAALVICLALAAATGQAAAGETFVPMGDTARVGDMLLPETSSWVRLDSVPRPAAAEWDNGLLARLAAQLSPFLTAEHCGFVTNIMQMPSFRDRVRAGDIFGPGDDNVVYEGPSTCGESDVTVIWRHVHDPATLSSVTLFSKVLRVEAAVLQPRFSNVEAGSFDTYHIATLELGDVRAVYVDHHLKIPAAARPRNGRIVLKTVTKLALAPGGGDGGSVAVQAGIDGEALADYRDDAGRTWRLVAAPRRSPSSVGWIAGSAD